MRFSVLDVVYGHRDLASPCTPSWLVASPHPRARRRANGQRRPWHGLRAVQTAAGVTGGGGLAGQGGHKHELPPADPPHLASTGIALPSVLVGGCQVGLAHVGWV
jgi:hypothetical protein